MKEKIYLGDGLYAFYDGFQIELSAYSEGQNNVVYLEPSVFKEWYRPSA